MIQDQLRPVNIQSDWRITVFLYQYDCILIDKNTIIQSNRLFNPVYNQNTNSNLVLFRIKRNLIVVYVSQPWLQCKQGASSECSMSFLGADLAKHKYTQTNKMWAQGVAYIILVASPKAWWEL